MKRKEKKKDTAVSPHVLHHREHVAALPQATHAWSIAFELLLAASSTQIRHHCCIILRARDGKRFPANK